MSVVTIKAHYDGNQICLDEPIDLAPNTPVLVTIAQPNGADADRAEWFALAKAAFAKAYGDNEPDYSQAVILERPSE
jgi:hypothetical protein